MDEKGDVGLLEDLFFGLKNLTALEDHCKSSYYVTKDKKWLELGDYAREVRTKWMRLFVKKDDGHLWCSTKHMSNIIMSAQEVSARLSSTGKKEQAEEFEEDAKTFIGMVFLLNEIESKTGGK